MGAASIAVVIVLVEPVPEVVGSLVVCGPLGGEGSLVALDFPVGLGPVRPGEDVIDID